MKKKLKMDFLEQSIMLACILRWVILAVFLGVVVGGVTGFFLKLLNFGIYNSSKLNYYYLLMPLAFFLSSWLIVKFAPDAEGHGTEKVIEAIHQKKGKIDIKVIPIKLFATLITLVTGGSAGKEGPCAQIGAGIASYFSDLFRINNTSDRKKFVICGISAGFAGVFGTPVAGAIFAAEVLYVGRFSYGVLLPSLIASYVSSLVTQALGIQRLSYGITFSHPGSIPLFLNLILFGIFLGSLAMMFIRILYTVEEFFHNMKIYKPYKGILGGLIVIFIFYLTGSRDSLGLGLESINKSISGESVGGLSFLFKMFTTSFTLGSGGSGGILTPIFYIGATAGNVWGQFISGNIALFSAIGMVGFLAACANTPIAAIIIAMELFGVEIGGYASIPCVISYLMVGHKSVYPTQILVINKSPLIDLKMNCKIGEIKEPKFRDEHKLLRLLCKNKNT